MCFSGSTTPEHYFFTLSLSEGTLPISWCPEISFYVARHFDLIFLNEFSSAPTHPLNHGFVVSREDTERCWCFWLVFMPSVPIFFLCLSLFFNEYTWFLALCAGAHLLTWHSSCLQVESEPCWRGVGFRQQWFFKQSSRSPTWRGSPVSALAPAASLHIHTPVDTTAQKASGATWVREGGHEVCGLPGKLLA